MVDGKLRDDNVPNGDHRYNNGSSAENGCGTLIGVVITILVILALIAAVWGRSTAKGCAAWLFSGVVILVLLFLLGAMGAKPEAFGTVLRWMGVALAVYFIALFTYGKVDEARQRAQKEQRQQARENRQRHAAHAKQSVDDIAQVALQAEKQRRISAPHRLREALDSGDVRTAHDICRQCAFDWHCIALQWQEEGNLLSWMDAYPPAPDAQLDEARFIRFSSPERDAMLRGVMGALEEDISAVGQKNGDNARVDFALFALAGFGAELGAPRPLFVRSVRLLRGVTWDPKSPQERRVAALLALGIAGCEYADDGDVHEEGSGLEPLATHLKDDDFEVRAATAYAIGLRLRQHDDSAEIPDADDVAPDDLSQIADEAQDTYAQWKQQYERTVASLLLPLLTGDPDPQVRGAAASALASIEANAVRAALRQRAMAHDELESVRQAATNALQPRVLTHGSSAVDWESALASAQAYLAQYQSRSTVLLPSPTVPVAQRGGTRKPRANSPTTGRRTRRIHEE